MPALVLVHLDCRKKRLIPSLVGIEYMMTMMLGIKKPLYLQRFKNVIEILLDNSSTNSCSV